MHILRVPSFFFTNNTEAIHGDVLGWINPCFNKYYSWTFNSCNSAEAIQYRVFEIGSTPGNKSTTSSTSRLGGKVFSFSENTSRNSFTIGTCSTRTLLFGWVTIYAMYPTAHFLSSFPTRSPEIKPKVPCSFLKLSFFYEFSWYTQINILHSTIYLDVILRQPAHA